MEKSLFHIEFLRLVLSLDEPDIDNDLIGDNLTEAYAEWRECYREDFPLFMERDFFAHVAELLLVPDQYLNKTWHLF